MDTLAHDQQQKDFMSTFFSSSVDHGNHNVDHSQHQQPLYNGASLQPGMHGHDMHSSMNANHSNMALDMDALGNFMAMQGIESPQALSPSQAPYNPQVLLEQQIKVTQLQQLQQLQNQIFMQQVSKYFLCNEVLAPSTGGEYMERILRERWECFFCLSWPFLQIALISGQPGGNASEMVVDPHRDQRPSHTSGLPTPG
jgi:hypothetical protein